MEFNRKTESSRQKGSVEVIKRLIAAMVAGRVKPSTALFICPLIFVDLFSAFVSITPAPAQPDTPYQQYLEAHRRYTEAAAAAR